MTSLVSWIGIDSRAPASLYLASDSRVSWDPVRGWNHGRKVFASRLRPDIFGYCGDVLFPSLFLGQAIELIDDGLLFSTAADHCARATELMSFAAAAFLSYPVTERQPFQFVYGSRDGSGMKSLFQVSVIAWEARAGFALTHQTVPQQSAPLIVLGSGRNSVDKWYERWNRTDHKRTSRAVFSAFCDSLSAGDDPRSGGAPQLVGIYRQGSARTIGAVFRSQKYRLGLSVDCPTSSLEWRNELFELCDGLTGEKLPTAQTHHAPRGLGNSRPKWA